LTTNNFQQLFVGCENLSAPICELFDSTFLDNTQETLFGPRLCGPRLCSDAYDPKEYARSKYRRRMIAEERKRQTQRNKELKSGRKSLPKNRKELLKKPHLYSDSFPGLSALAANGCTSMAKTWMQCVEQAQDKGYEDIISVVEQILLLYFALKDAKNARHFASIVMLYLSSKVERGLCNAILRLVFSSETEEGIGCSSFFTDTPRIEEMCADFASQKDFEKFSESLSNASTKYSDFRKSAIFDKVTDLMSILLAVGLINDNKTLPVTVKGIELYRFHAAKGRKNYGDLVESLLDTAKFLVERGHKCFTESSWYPLMYSEDKGLAFEKEYCLLIGNFEFVRLGQYIESPFLDHAEFDLRLTNAITVCEGLLNACPKGERAFITKRLENLNKIRATDKLINHGGGLRPAPFTFLIHGTSSIAKSSIVNNLMTYCLQRMALEEGKEDYVVDPDAICTLNEMDKYHSDYKSFTQAVLLDDLANAKRETVDVNPTVNIINFVNNIKRTAIMAEANLKGMIQLNPRLVCATTNVWEKWAREYSNEPLSALRRFQYHIRARVKSDFRKSGTVMVDGKKLAEATNAENFCPDAWEFDVYEYIGVDEGKDTCQKPVAELVYFPNAAGRAQEAYQLNFGELMQLLAHGIHEHRKIQYSVVETSQKTFAQKLCPHGSFPTWCKECGGSNFYSTEHMPKDRQYQVVPMDDEEELYYKEKARLQKEYEKKDIVSRARQEFAEEHPDWLPMEAPARKIFPKRKGRNGRRRIRLPTSSKRLQSDAGSRWTNYDLPRDHPYHPRHAPFMEYEWVPAYVKFAYKMWLNSTLGLVKFAIRDFRDWYRENVHFVDAAFMACGSIPPGFYRAETWMENQTPKQLKAVLITWRSAFKTAGELAHAEYQMRKAMMSERIGEAREELHRWRKSPWNDYTSYIPKRLFESAKMQWLITWTRSREFVKQYTNFSRIYATCVLGLGYFDPAVFVPGVASYIVGSVIILRARKDWLIAKVSESRELMPGLVKKIRDHEISMGKLLFVCFAAVLALYALYLMIRKLRGTLKADGNGMSVTAEENNVWLAPTLEPLPEGVDVHHSVDGLTPAVHKNLANVCLGGKVSNGLFIDSNLLLLPHHVMPTSEVNLQITMSNPEFMCGKNFECMISPTDCCRLHSESDLMAVYVARSGDMKNLTKFFPDELTKREISTRMLWKSADGERHQTLTKFNSFGKVKSDHASFTNGAYYRMSNPSFAGLCCATHLFESSTNCYIAGFHLAGTRKADGLNAAEMVTKDMISKVRDQLDSRTSIIFTSSSANMRTDAYGISFVPEPEIPMRSPLRYQESGQVAHFGSLPQFRVRPKSSVITSPISPLIEEHCGVPQQWGPPANCRKDETKIRDWAPYQKYIAGAGNAFQEFPEHLLSRAVDDYIGQIDRMCATQFGKGVLSNVRVLSEVETVSGVDGLKFVDAMKTGTSMGFPINKSKENFIITLDPEEFEQECPRTLDAETLSLAEEARECYARRERHYPVFKACTKDEPTKLSKLKVRVFQAAPAALQYNIRKYFLTICHFMSSAPLTTECAVGINSQGPAWTELNEHICKFGDDRMVAGDFKAYDQHMSARMVLCAFTVFEHIARKAGYSDEDLLIMRGIASDVAYPVVNLNGELIQLFGSNPSGQNLTVYVNSVVNSIYQRCVFFALYPDYKGFFDDAVALITYGDDNKMGVSKDYPKYNHTNMQKVYARYGIEYTMADKEAESVPYVTNSGSDFIKRDPVFVEKYSYTDFTGEEHHGMYWACLDQMSIFKSLHCNLASQAETPIAVAAQCLDQAMSEFFFHGPEVFKERHDQLKRVVIEAGLSDVISPRFYQDFDTREALWMEKYGISIK
jgi:hypothetical protein